MWRRMWLLLVFSEVGKRIHLFEVMALGKWRYICYKNWAICKLTPAGCWLLTAVQAVKLQANVEVTLALRPSDINVSIAGPARVTKLRTDQSIGFLIGYVYT